MVPIVYAEDFAKAKAEGVAEAETKAKEEKLASARKLLANGIAPEIVMHSLNISRKEIDAILKDKTFKKNQGTSSI